MNLFDWLLVSHLVGDFLLQTDRMAHNKAQSWRWMLRHVGTYIVMVSVVLVTYGVLHNLPAWAVVCAILFLFGTHVLLDRRHLTLWWMRRIGMTLESQWLSIVVDQIYHVATLAIVAQVLALVQR